MNSLLVSKDIYIDIYTERGELLFSFLGKCINQLLFVRTGIVEASTNILQVAGRGLQVAGCRLQVAGRMLQVEDN